MSESGVAPIDRGVGGLEPGLPLVLDGAAGSGRTVLCLELTAAALARGESVAYVSAEPPGLIVRQAAALGFDLEPPLRSERLALFELDPGAAAAALAHGAGAFVDALRAEVPGAQLWILDPITALTREIFDERPLQQLLRTIFEHLPHPTARLVATADRELLEAEVATDRALRNLCGAYVMLDRDAAGTRTLHVAKSRSDSPDTGNVLFRIGSGGSEIVEAGAAPRSPLTRATDRTRRRPKLLVVEQDAELRADLESWLSERWDVVTAGDGVAALTRVLAERPDLIVLDLHMSRIPGRELLLSMRQGGVGVPVLAVSAQDARSSDRVSALVLGATDVVEKPLARFELIHRVESLLRLPVDGGFELEPDAHLIAPLRARCSRTVSREVFEERLERSVRFGEMFGIESCIVFLESADETAFDDLVAAADDVMRAEDALLALSERQAALLLVASGPAQAAGALARLYARFEARRGSRGAQLAQRAIPAADALDGDRESDWKSICQSLEPWPPAAPR